MPCAQFWRPALFRNWTPRAPPLMTDVYEPQLSMHGRGDAIVLVPGINGSGELFYRQIPLLARSYRVATYSLRDNAGSLDTLADDLARVVDAASPVDRRAMIV